MKKKKSPMGGTIKLDKTLLNKDSWLRLSQDYNYETGESIIGESILLLQNKSAIEHVNIEITTVISPEEEVNAPIYDKLMSLGKLLEDSWILLATATIPNHKKIPIIILHINSLDVTGFTQSTEEEHQSYINKKAIAFINKRKIILSN